MSLLFALGGRWLGCALAPDVVVPIEPAPEPSAPSSSRWYIDADGDGFGNPAAEAVAPVAPPGHVAVGADCDDTDPSVYPNAHDVRGDGIDQDCDGVDNVCEGFPDYPGDLVIEGFGAADQISRLCDEFAGVSGTVSIRRSGLETLEPLRCLCWIGSLELDFNYPLRDVSALDDIVLTGNPSTLVVTDGLGTSQLAAHVSGPMERLAVVHAPLTTISVSGVTTADEVVFQDLSGLHTVAAMPELTSAGMVVFDALPELSTLPELPLLRQVDVLSIMASSVDSLAPLGALETIDKLVLSNLSITTLDDLRGLTRLGALELRGVPLADLRPLSAVSALDSLVIEGAPSPSTLAGLEGLHTLGNLVLVGTELTSLEALANLEVIEGDLELVGNGQLRTLAGLENVREIGGNLTIQGNHFVGDVTALHGTTVAGSVHVSGFLLSPEQVAALVEAVTGAP